MTVTTLYEPPAEEKPASASKPPVHVRYRCEPLQDRLPVQILALRMDDCRWVVEQDGSHGYCGLPKDTSRVTSYCKVHTGFAFRGRHASGPDRGLGAGAGLAAVWV